MLGLNDILGKWPRHKRDSSTRIVQGLKFLKWTDLELLLTPFQFEKCGLGFWSESQMETFANNDTDNRFLFLLLFMCSPSGNFLILDHQEHFSSRPCEW